jgi:hypothetical protein
MRKKYKKFEPSPKKKIKNKREENKTALLPLRTSPSRGA